MCWKIYRLQGHARSDLTNKYVFSALHHKRHDFRKREGGKGERERKKQLLNKNARFDFLYNFRLKHSPFLEEPSEINHKSTLAFVQGARYIYHILFKLNFLNRFSKNIKLSYFKKNPSSRNRFSSVRADGRTDATKLTVAFQNSATAPNSSHFAIT
jgi:hypothetical protein